jgi:energy-coupling factor transporter ATP-binding protein EcfA2
MKPFVLAIVGDSGSGKSTLADSVTALLGRERVTDVLLDDYHRFTREERAAREATALNPIVHNFPLIQEHLQLLRQGRPIRNRSYEHANGTFGAIRTIEPREIGWYGSTALVTPPLWTIRDARQCPGLQEAVATAVSAAWKPIFECCPSQNGLVTEPPQRHRKTRFLSDTS